MSTENQNSPFKDRSARSRAIATSHTVPKTQFAHDDRDVTPRRPRSVDIATAYDVTTPPRPRSVGIPSTSRDRDTNACEVSPRRRSLGGQDARRRAVSEEKAVRRLDDFLDGRSPKAFASRIGKVG